MGSQLEGIGDTLLIFEGGRKPRMLSGDHIKGWDEKERKRKAEGIEAQKKEGEKGGRQPRSRRKKKGGLNHGERKRALSAGLQKIKESEKKKGRG